MCVCGEFEVECEFSTIMSNFKTPAIVGLHWSKVFRCETHGQLSQRSRFDCVVGRPSPLSNVKTLYRCSTIESI
jgi:hypothetical protein